MEFYELVDKVRELLPAHNSIEGKYAVQVDVWDIGVFYIECINGCVDVQPYDYYNRDVIIYIDEKNLFEFLSGKQVIMTVRGSQEKISLLKKLVEK